MNDYVWINIIFIFIIDIIIWRVLSQNGLSAIFEIFKVMAPLYTIQNNTFLMIPFSLYMYIKEYFWSYDQKFYKFSYYCLYISAA